MKHLILSAAVTLLVVNPLVAKAAETFTGTSAPARRDTPVIVAGFFDVIQDTVNDLKDTIQDVGDTAKEVKGLSDDLTSGGSQNSSTNQFSTKTSTTGNEVEFKTDQDQKWNDGGF